MAVTGLKTEDIDPEFLLTDRRDSLIHASSGSPLCDSLELGTGHTGRSQRAHSTPSPAFRSLQSHKTGREIIAIWRSVTVRTQAHRRES